MEKVRSERPKRGLGLKFIVFVNTVFILFGSILGITLLVGFKQSLEKRIQNEGLSLAENIAAKYSSDFSGRSTGPVSIQVKEIIRYSNAAYAVILDEEGKVLSASDESGTGELLKDPLTVQALKVSRSSVFRYEASGESFYDIAAPIYLKSGASEEVKKIGVVRVGLSLKEVHQQVKKFALITFSVLGILSCVGIFISMFFVQIIIKPLERMTELAVQMAGGDFSRTIEVKTRDEVGILASAFSQMSSNLKEMMKKVQDASQHMTAVAEQMQVHTQKVSQGSMRQSEATERTSSSIEEMNASVRSISESIDSVSSSSQEAASSLTEMSVAVSQVASSTVILSSSVEDTASSLVQISASIKQVADHIESLSASAQETTSSIMEINSSIVEVGRNAKESAQLSEKVSQDAAALGVSAIEKTIEGMEKIKKTVDQSASVIAKLDERTEHVGKILTVIDEVTSQTNLLALNAAILAAQAGNEGKAFAVVADEIKNLSDRTSASTKEIAQLIRGVQAEAKDAVTAIKEGTKSVEDGVRLSIDARASLHQILQTSKRSFEMSRQIENATVEQVRATGQVSTLMDRVNVMVQQIHTAMQEMERGTVNITKASEKMRSITHQVKTSTEEQAQGSKQISGAVENVSGRIQQIAEAMNEQKKGNEVIRNSMADIHKITQNSVELVKEMNVAMEALTAQVYVLNQGIHYFKI